MLFLLKIRQNALSGRAPTRPAEGANSATKMVGLTGGIRRRREDRALNFSLQNHAYTLMNVRTHIIDMIVHFFIALVSKHTIIVNKYDQN